jgi:hypothetical protein
MPEHPLGLQPSTYGAIFEPMQCQYDPGWVGRFTLFHPAGLPPDTPSHPVPSCAALPPWPSPTRDATPSQNLVPWAEAWSEKPPILA